jgi:hypothetical protein
VQTIRLPSGRQVSIKSYVHAWKTLRAFSQERLKEIRVPNFDHFPESGEHVLREIRRNAVVRLNNSTTSLRTGRKWSPDYQIRQSRDARRIAEYVTRQIVDPINRLETTELQSRFKWRYTSDGLEITLRANE